MVSGPSIPSVNESLICKTGKMPGITRQRQYTSHMGSSLRVLGGPFNLEQDSCQWLELKETESSCQITGNVKCQACWQDPSQLGWSSRQASRSSGETKYQVEMRWNPSRRLPYPASHSRLRLGGQTAAHHRGAGHLFTGLIPEFTDTSSDLESDVIKTGTRCHWIEAAG